MSENLSVLQMAVSVIAGYFGLSVVPSKPATMLPNPEPVQTAPAERMARHARRRPRTENRVVYRMTATPKAIKARMARKAVIESLLPMERIAWDYISGNQPVSQSCREIAKGTDANLKTTESALWRLRRIHGLVESVGAKGDAQA